MVGHEVDFPFNDWSKDRMAKGLKKMTSRTSRHAQIGDTFKCVEKTWLVVGVGWVKLGYVAKYCYALEGAMTPQEFIDVWNQIHPKKKFDPEEEVCAHFFEVA